MLFRWLASWKWKRTQKVTPNELRVIQALFSGDDPRFALVLDHLNNAKYVERTILDKSSYRLTPVWASDAPVHLNDVIDSRPLITEDAKTGRLIEFCVSVVDGGLFSLEGRAVDGGLWPSTFEVRPDFESAFRGKQFLFLPKESQDFVGLAEWIRLPVAEIDQADMHLFNGASDDEIASVERSERCKLPGEFVDFLRVSNGMVYRESVIYGTADIYVSDISENKPLLVIGSVEEVSVFAVEPTASPTSKVWEIPVGVNAITDQMKRAETIKSFVRSMIRVRLV